MRSGLAVCLLLLICLGLPALAQDSSFYAPPVVTVPKVKVAPTVDGILAPGEWAQAAPLSPFVAVGGKALPQCATEVWVTYDDHSLYIGALLHDPEPTKLKADATDRDGPVWTDDSLELFFDTEDQRKGYIHLAVNPKEVQYDALGKDKSADYRWTARAATLSNGWSVELELPFANDYPPAAGIAWGFLVGRHVASSGENSSWARCEQSFHELARLGSLVFSVTPLQVDLAALGGLWVGENTAQMSLRNPAGSPAATKVNVRVMGRGKAGNFFGVTKVAVPAGAKVTQSVPYRVPQDGFSTVAFSLSDATGRTVWRSAPYPVLTPEVAPKIAAIEQSLAAAMKEWMLLPDGEGKSGMKEELEGLAVQWRYLASQYRDRSRLDRAALEDLGAFASKLQGEVNMLAQRVKAARLSGRTDVRFLAGAVSDLQAVKPENLDVPLDLTVNLDACRNETEGAQVVVLPFR